MLKTMADSAGLRLQACLESSSSRIGVSAEASAGDDLRQQAVPAMLPPVLTVIPGDLIYRLFEYRALWLAIRTYVR